MERKRGREETEEEEEAAAPPSPAQRPAPYPPLPLPLPMLLQPLWLLTLPVQLPCVLDHECKYVATSALELSRHIWRHWHTAQLGHPIWYAWSDTPTAVGNGPLMGPAGAGSLATVINAAMSNKPRMETMKAFFGDTGEGIGRAHV